MSERPEPKDPKLCQLPHCPRLANGHDWILFWNTRGEALRDGFCSQAHARIADRWLAGVQHGLILESNPEDNFEDRVRMEKRGGGP